ncbi:MAG: aspartyl/asparaginyl beta-hydroxylase domain-containing protein [Pseudomonadota bacterium]|nr:aspartyl/asparaginyl beta-hydroxylase domain-containing protein [Pseudomonadota bacterium]
MTTTDLETGWAALQRGDLRAARSALQGATAATANDVRAWLLLAQCCAAQGDAAAEERALDGALVAEPRNLLALLAKGERAKARGDDRAAVSYFTMALQVERGALPPAIVERLRQAAIAVDAAGGRFEQHLEESLVAAGVAPDVRPRRFSEALDIMAGRKQVQLQQPTSFFYPGLPQTCFYDPGQFDWVAGFEAQVPAMRDEVEQLLAGESGFHPYVEGDPNRPNRGHALLGDARWSAFDLWKGGVEVEDNARRCPATMAALRTAPMPRIAGRSPMALFSQLRPHTHIPPHWGMLNTRLICHIPLIVPSGCRLRVGNEVRNVEAGKAMIFDDSIEHEAWNDSDQTRIVLLFEVWRPELDAAERASLTAMFEAISTYESALSDASRLSA